MLVKVLFKYCQSGIEAYLAEDTEMLRDRVFQYNKIESDYYNSLSRFQKKYYDLAEIELDTDVSIDDLSNLTICGRILLDIREGIEHIKELQEGIE